jgi:hypothetical protein
MMLRPLLAASAVLLVALPARAERPNDAATLEYLPSRATVALCPKADFLALEVRVRLGYELFQPSAPNHLTVKVDRANGRFRSIGEIRDDDGKVIFARTYSEIDCTAALFSMAMSVSIQFTRAPEDPASPAPSVLAPSPASCPPAPEPMISPPSSVTPPPDPSSYQVGLASVFSLGTAPVVVGGVGWFFGMRWRDISAALEGRALFAPSAEIGALSARFLFAAISLSPCIHYAWAFACGRVEVGSLVAGETAAARTNNNHALSLGAGMRFGGDLSISRAFALRPYLDILAEPIPARVFFPGDEHALWSSPPLSASVGIAFVMSLQRN